LIAELPQGKRVEVRIETGPAHACGDRRLVRLIVLHLLERAIQVTNEGVVQVSVQFRKNTYRISVRDRGLTVSPEERLQLFEPTRSRWRSGAGFGLGLYVVRDIARALGGDIMLEAADGDGNVLTLELPSESKSSSVSATPSDVLEPTVRALTLPF